MRTIPHWIGGSQTTGASTRYGPVWNPATGAQQAQVALAEPSDVADVCLFLASPLASYVNGVVLEVAGGRGI